MKVLNLLDTSPVHTPDELFITVLRANNFRIERIVSCGHVSPPDYWYDQEENEWVMILEGNAALQFEGEAEPVKLGRGSCLNIPAHARHRVVWTDPNQNTVWLAIYYQG